MTNDNKSLHQLFIERVQELRAAGKMSDALFAKADLAARYIAVLEKFPEPTSPLTKKAAEKAIADFEDAMKPNQQTWMEARDVWKF